MTENHTSLRLYTQKNVSQVKRKISPIGDNTITYTIEGSYDKFNSWGGGGGWVNFFYAEGPRRVHQIYQQLATVHNGNLRLCAAVVKKLTNTPTSHNSLQQMGFIVLNLLSWILLFIF